MDVRDLWVVYVWSQTIHREELSGWLDEHGEFRRCDPRSRDRVLTVETDELPAPWRRLFARPPVRSLSLEEDGTAVVVLRGSRREIQDTLASLGRERELEHVVPTGAPSSASPSSVRRSGETVTDAERKALVEAFREGYFDVPREIRLADLADEMDRSGGALSQLLRRGLRRLVASYVAELPEEPPPRVDGRREEDWKPDASD